MMGARTRVGAGQGSRGATGVQAGLPWAEGYTEGVGGGVQSWARLFESRKQMEHGQWGQAWVAGGGAGSKGAAWVWGQALPWALLAPPVPLL